MFNDNNNNNNNKFGWKFFNHFHKLWSWNGKIRENENVFCGFFSLSNWIEAKKKYFLFVFWWENSNFSFLFTVHDTFLSLIFEFFRKTFPGNCYILFQMIFYASLSYQRGIQRDDRESSIGGLSPSDILASPTRNRHSSAQWQTHSN